MGIWKFPVIETSHEETSVEITVTHRVIFMDIARVHLVKISDSLSANPGYLLRYLIYYTPT